MLIEKRAGNLSQKLSNAGIGSKPIIFIVHSMGGLVVKALVVYSALHADADRRRLTSQVKGIVFCGTPHRGSEFADSAYWLSLALGGVQTHVKEMRANTESIDLLHERFIEWHRQQPIQIVSYAENIGLFRKTFWARLLPFRMLGRGGLVVPRASANTGLAGQTVHDVDEDHLSLVKPCNRSHDVYAGVLRHVLQVLPHARVIRDDLLGDPDQEVQSDNRAARRSSRTGKIFLLIAILLLMSAFGASFAIRQFAKTGESYKPIVSQEQAVANIEISQKASSAAASKPLPPASNTQSLAPPQPAQGRLGSASAPAKIGSGQEFDDKAWLDKKKVMASTSIGALNAKCVKGPDDDRPIYYLRISGRSRMVGYANITVRPGEPNLLPAGGTLTCDRWPSQDRNTCGIQSRTSDRESNWIYETPPLIYNGKVEKIPVIVIIKGLTYEYGASDGYSELERVEVVARCN
jgi:hypothetical protein